MGTKIVGERHALGGGDRQARGARLLDSPIRKDIALLHVHGEDLGAHRRVELIQGHPNADVLLCGEAEPQREDT